MPILNGARQNARAASYECGKDYARLLHFAVAHDTEREAVIDRRALETSALQHAMGAIDLDDLRRDERCLGRTQR